jgi:hypothetical protein
MIWLRRTRDFHDGQFVPTSPPSLISTESRRACVWIPIHPRARITPGVSQVSAAERHSGIWSSSRIRAGIRCWMGITRMNSIRIVGMWSLLLGHHMLTRGGDRREAEISDLFAFEFKGDGGPYMLHTADIYHAGWQGEPVWPARDNWCYAS